MSYYPPQAPPGGPAKKRKGNPTLAWALITFTILALLGALVILVIMTGGQLPEFGSGPSWTPRPAPTATPLPESTPETGATSEAEAPPEQPPERSFDPGDPVLNASPGPVNLRRSPGYLNKPGDDVITTIPAGSRGAVIDGPQAADGLTWWQVRFPARGKGWMAERSSSGKVLLDLAK